MPPTARKPSSLRARCDPDVVALDISMPVMDGFEAAAQLEQLRAAAGRADAHRVERRPRTSTAPGRPGAGYVTKDAIAASLVDAILAAARR